MKCPICDSIAKKNIGEKNSFRINECKGCLTIYVEKIEDSINYFDYSNYYGEDNLNIPDFIFDTYRNTIKDFEPYRNTNRFLDVGCGAGTLLDIGKELNWDVFGVEVSKPAAEHLSKRGLNVFHGTLEEANFPNNNFDVITCTEVIEHVTNPKELLKEIARIITPKGILWMTTPHSRGLSGRLLGANWSAVAPPEHLNLFSVESLKMCLEEVGFKKHLFISSGFNPFEIYQKFRKIGGQINRENVQKSEEKKMSPGFERVTMGYKLNKWFVSGKNKQKIKDSINFLLNKTNSGDTIKVWASLE
jgi:2-polyprenyl-3-methyl-5-hydroxy-6-metoxy-1,4-benzoquinol methylase